MRILKVYKIDMIVKSFKCGLFIFVYIKVEYKSYIVDESKQLIFFIFLIFDL